MDKYILELTENSNRINIPGFGAILVSRDNGRNILFNQFLNFNDGTLAGFVAKKREISEDEALKEIEEYVAGIKSKLDADGNYTILGIGTFTRSDDGSLNFVQIDATDSDTESIDAAKAAPKSEVSANEEKEIVAAAKREPVIDIVVDSPKVTKPAPKPVYVKSNESQPALEENGRGKTLVVIAIIILLLLGCYLCLFVFCKNNFVYRYFYNDREIELVEPQQKDSVVTEPAVVEQPAEPEISKPAVAKHGYNIIVGSYKTEAIAQARVKELIEKGFENSYQYQRGEWFVVSINTLPTLEEAERIQEHIVDTYRIESWIANAD